MPGKREERTDGLRPAGIQRLRELRDENTTLKLKLSDVEQALEQERSEHKVDNILREYRSDAADRQPPPPAKKEAEPSGPGTGARSPPTAPHGTAHVLGNIAFYLAMALLLVGAVLVRSAKNGAPVQIAGYSGMLVLTGSMQDVIPQGSFILTKSVDPESLQIGDDITFMVSSTTSVTHRIVDIRRQADGTLAFQTQGVNNQYPDSSLAAEGNMVGKVVYHNLLLGQAAQWISANWPLLLFLLAVWAALGKFLAYTAAPKKKKGRRLKDRSDANATQKTQRREKYGHQEGKNLDHRRRHGGGDRPVRHLRLVEHQPDGAQRDQERSQPRRASPR